MELKGPLDALVRVAGDAASASSLRRSFAGDEQMVAVRLLRERMLGVLVPLSMKVAPIAAEHVAVRDFVQGLMGAAMGVPLRQPSLPVEVAEQIPFAAYEPVPLDDRPLASALEVGADELAAREALARALGRIRSELEQTLPREQAQAFFPLPPGGAGAMS